MDEQYKFVEYENYCETCIHYKNDDYDDKCHDCMNEPARLNSHKPVNYTKAE